ncbi:MAG TPA: TetR/AcrR family transcriptional regulator [Tichowtungia sp.]|nr:TetR/AcrR family transcriptional regulator [Tichowtungia sp.]
MTRDRKKNEKRAAILTAAQAEFEGRFFADVTLENIATRAGVGKGTLYLYFKNKEDLFLQLAVDGMDEMAERVREMTVSEQPYADIFCTLGGELVDFFQERVGLVRLMQQTGSEQILKEFNKYRDRMKKAVRAFLERGVAEGVLRDDFPVDALQVALVGPLLLRGRFLEDGEKVSSAAMLQIIWDGLRKNRG